MSKVKFPKWAVTNLKETIPSTNDGEAKAIVYNKKEIPDQLMSTGWTLKSKISRQEMNQLFYMICYYLNRPESFLKNDLPDAADKKAQIVFVSDIDSGTLAYSDGTNWKKITIGGNI